MMVADFFSRPVAACHGHLMVIQLMGEKDGESCQHVSFRIHQACVQMGEFGFTVNDMPRWQADRELASHKHSTIQAAHAEAI